jgi:transposase
MEQFVNGSRPRRREYSRAFKAQVLNECAQPGASVGGVALSHGLHANMVHRWLREAKLAQTFTAQLSADAPAAFIALPLPECAPQAMPATPMGPPPTPTRVSVQVRLQRGDLVVSLSCPISDCAALLREVLR